jgi:RNA recognition motif-containing protein
MRVVVVGDESMSRDGGSQFRSDCSMGRKLYVGNLSFRVTDQDLANLFSQAGSCQSASVITDRMTGQSRGFGFVEMGSDAEAEAAIQQFNGHELLGRAIRVNEAQERERSGGGGGGGGRGPGGGFGGGRGRGGRDRR